MNNIRFYILKFVMILMICGACFTAYATQIPKSGSFDGRVKSVIYNPKQVIKIIGHYGYATHIQLSHFETVSNIAMGDSEGWEIAPTGNHIFLKPKGKKANTNMTIITNKRVYNFDLEAKYAFGSRYLNSGKMYYQINFVYPDEEAQKKKNQEEATQLRNYLNDSDVTMPLNWNYWAKGTDIIKPIKLFDDGRFTYMRFAQNTDMPAIYTLDADDKESLVNTTINPQAPDTIIIQKIAHRMVLRKGDLVVLIVNHAYSAKNMNAYKHDTTMPMVKRVIKGHNHAR